MGGLRDSRLVVIACTLTCIFAGLALEFGMQTHRTSVAADRIRLVRTSPAGLVATTSRVPPSAGVAEPSSSGPPTSDGPAVGTSAKGPPGKGKGGSGPPGPASTPGRPAGTTGPPKSATTGRPAPAGCSSPRTVHGFKAYFTFPCENSSVATYPKLVIHVSGYPAAGHGGFTVVQTVLTDRDGPIKERPVFAMIPGVTLPGTNLSNEKNTWSNSAQVGTPCIHDRGRTTLGIYFLTEAGVAKARATWLPGVPVGRLPAGSELMDQVTVNRRGSCPEDPPTGPGPTTDPPPTSPSPTTSPTPTGPSPTTPSPTGPSPTAPSPTTPSPTTALPAGP